MSAGDSPASPCASDVEAELTVTANDVGSASWRPSQPQWAELRAALEQLGVERWAGRAHPLQTARQMRPLLSLLGYDRFGQPDLQEAEMPGLLHDLTNFLHQYMLTLWSAGCYRAYAASFQLAEQARPGACVARFVAARWLLTAFAPCLARVLAASTTDSAVECGWGALATSLARPSSVRGERGARSTLCRDSCGS